MWSPVTTRVAAHDGSGVTLTGGGTVDIGGAGGDTIEDSGTAVTLTNVNNTISGKESARSAAAT